MNFKVQQAAKSLENLSQASDKIFRELASTNQSKSNVLKTTQESTNRTSLSLYSNKEFIQVPQTVQRPRGQIPFKNFQSKLGIATVMTFFGDTDEVSSLMQRLSHKTYKYFINEKKLSGFLVHSISAILRRAQKGDEKD